MYEAKSVSEIMFNVAFMGVPVQTISLCFVIVWGTLFIGMMYQCYKYFKETPTMTMEQTIIIWSIICTLPFSSFVAAMILSIVLYLAVLVYLGLVSWFRIIITTLF